MNEVHPVSITLNDRTRSYTAAFQTDPQFDTGWQSVLKSAYGRGELHCCCRGVGPKRLAVKHYEGSGQFALARFSLTGGQHAQDCQYYSANLAHAGEGGYAEGVLDQRPDGSVKIRLAVSMLERDGVAPMGSAGETSRLRNPSAKQSSMKLLGLLHYLWGEAGLNQWKPGFAGKRRSSLAYWWINNAADNVWAGDVKLAELLLVPAFGAETREAQRNRTRAASALQNRNRMLIIAPLAAFSQEQSVAMAIQLKIGGFHGMPCSFMQPGLWESTTKRFPSALAGWRNGFGTVAIAQVELKTRSKGVVASVIDLALMGVTADFVPVDSSLERIVADLLVKQGRSFTKPLRYDAGAEQVLPDFILTDTAKEVPLEVFGRDDADYLKRKVEKAAYYDEQYGPGGWWSWDASGNSSHSDFPPFPPAR